MAFDFIRETLPDAGYFRTSAQFIVERWHEICFKFRVYLYLRREAYAFGQPRGSEVLLRRQNLGVIVRPELVKREPGEMGARSWSPSNDCAAKHRNLYP